MQPFFNIAYKQVGGIRFLRLGRLSFTFSVASEHRPVELPAQPGFSHLASAEYLAAARSEAQARHAYAMRGDW